jgi:D-galactarolactone cycloisomerase
LGGKYLDKIPVYATGLMSEGEPEAVIDLAHQYFERGFRAMKLKIDENQREDMARLQALRNAFGPDLKIMVDANGAYDPTTALKIGRQLEKLDVFWFEEPVTPEDVTGMARVRDHLDIYVAAGECEYTKFGFRELFLNKAIDICQPDVSRAGGITECKRISTLAQAFNIHYAPHAWGGAVCIAATLHLAMSSPNFLICEFDQVPNPLRDKLPTEPLDFRDGFLHVADKPGLGIDLDEKVIQQCMMKT